MYVYINVLNVSPSQPRLQQLLLEVVADHRLIPRLQQRTVRHTFWRSVI